MSLLVDTSVWSGAAPRHTPRRGALIARLAVARGHTLLTTAADFVVAARHVDLRLWHPPAVTGTDTEPSQHEVP